MGHLLIIAPNAELRQSLRFALEADGHTVSDFADIEHVTELPEQVDCVILDHHGADGATDDVGAFFGTFQPIVLLANETSHPLSKQSFRTILKPRLGPFLAKAVSQAIATRAPAPSGAAGEGS